MSQERKMSELTITTSYTIQPDGSYRVSVSGCGWDIPDKNTGFPFITWTLPDGSEQSFYVGVWVGGCMDTNSLPTMETGAYAVTVVQTNKGGHVVNEASGTLTIP